MAAADIVVRGAREHNLQNVDLVIPRNKLVVMSGVSGSGKSSLAFDTVYAEGQRRYVESLSTYARQFLGQMPKPEVDSDSTYRRCPSAYTVSNASELFPDPDTPDITTSLFRGMTRSTFRRLCSRAPFTTMSAAAIPASILVLLNPPVAGEAVLDAPPQ